MNFVNEPPRKTPIMLSTDVLVAGAGVAGIAAALAAARHGKKVTLLEREFALGGMATLGLITIFLPLCDGAGNQVVFGLADELFKLSIKYSCEGKYPSAWLENGSLEERIKTRYMAQYNPQLFALTVEKLLKEAGVEILYGTSLVGTIVEEGFIKAVVVENKSGRTAIEVESAIDCTGDSDLSYHAGASTYTNPKGNGLASWYYYFNGDEVKLKMFGLADVVPDSNNRLAEDSKSYSSSKTESLDGNYRFSGVDGYELSASVLAGHEKMLSDILSQNEKNRLFVPVTMSTIPLVRMSRRLVGEYTMDTCDDHKPLADSVGMTGDWCKRGPVYEIPFGALHNNSIKNLLVAGRNISASDAMWNITRVIPPSIVSGQAAGTAAAIGNDFSSIDVSYLQKLLREDNVVLHLDDLK
ncbi:MAG: FAD-dependent oxidoreductase [Oscillospiraceae bacterium]|nr:FAD-dependent oxidoreductase [Oscillospiraceae bacterium]